jgi:hypothetical protein
MAMSEDQIAADNLAAGEAGHSRSNPSGLPDGHPAKVAQPVADTHHEEGHVDPDDFGGTPV